MNQDLFEDWWKEMRGQKIEWWGKLTGNHLEWVDGMADHLVDLLQRRYGHTRQRGEVVFPSLIRTIRF